MTAQPMTADQITGTDHLVDGWEVIIGLEVHIELNTKTKMFSPTPNAFGAEPNTLVGAIDLALPGTLPTVNRQAVADAIMIGLATNCSISPNSHFSRKNYFYPDMTKNYQTSQYTVAICENGYLDVDVDGQTWRIGIERIHMEEDTGKSTHVGESGRIHGAEHSLLDYNRGGVPLLECVSQPDMRTPAQAQAYLSALREIVAAIGISDARLEEGSMRCDANVSVHKPGTPFGVRAEVKNLNSVRSLGRAIEFEIRRQIDAIESGEKLVQETRHFNEDTGKTTTMRRKETLDDYRFFPCPDLPDICPSEAWIEEIRQSIPELPAATRARMIDQGVDAEAAGIIYSAGLAGLYDASIEAGAKAADVAKWLTNQVAAWQNETSRDVNELLDGATLAELLDLVAKGTLATQGAHKVLLSFLAGEGSIADLAPAHAQMNDTAELEAIIEQVIADNQDAADKVRAGNDKAIGALIGPIMKATRGKANPGLVNELLRAKLSS